MLDNSGELVAYGVVEVHLVLPPCAKLRSTPAVIIAAVSSQIRSVIQLEAYHLR